MTHFAALPSPLDQLKREGDAVEVRSWSLPTQKLIQQVKRATKTHRFRVSIQALAPATSGSFAWTTI